METKTEHIRDNTIRFAAFAPAFLACPCRNCPHRTSAQLKTADGRVVACARYRPEHCRGCPAMPKANTG